MQKIVHFHLGIFEKMDLLLDFSFKVFSITLTKKAGLLLKFFKEKTVYHKGGHLRQGMFKYLIVQEKKKKLLGSNWSWIFDRYILIRNISIFFHKSGAQWNRMTQSCHDISLTQLKKPLGVYVTDIERSEVLRMEFLFIPICSCQEHELIINSRCELSA
ncbi:hypothetical protein BpHYR1_013561 [Brachionus plicatilis]|uniref:Uncharacterized protein n=1 Tax=Brachionus plicatilis TaxID=10195 RepID=A0A3M7T8E5_BRAPC|nr:hypothetical protein BpHYR1_013561 [Brachionus plicatilis]